MKKGGERDLYMMSFQVYGSDAGKQASCKLGPAYQKLAEQFL